MANSNRVFVSPGVYTSEKDLTFVAQSVGVTTLGLVGETLKGPAFEPILISNFDEYKTYFGGTLAAKDPSGNPKYELPYVAKSYLQESNQLFVTRILGLTGYLPGKSYGIKTLGGFAPTGTGATMSEKWDNSVVTGATSADLDVTTYSTFTGSTLFAELSNKTAFDGSTVTDYIYSNFSGVTGGTDGLWFVIGQIPDSELPTGTTKEVVSAMTGALYADSSYNKNWYNVYNNGTNKVNSYVFTWNLGARKFSVKKIEHNSTLVNDGTVVATLRSRGEYAANVLNYRVTGSTHVQVTGANIATNPLSDFTLTVTGYTGGVTDTKTFACSLDMSSTKYITKVIGVEVFDKEKAEYPIYVHEAYPNLVKNLFEQGLIRGLSTVEYVKTEGNNFKGEWETPGTSTVVSEVRGGKVSDLFQILTVSDGNAANYNVKVTIQNLDLDTGEFDILVRDYFDSDDNQVVLEKFTRCTMNPDLPGYVARKVGTSDGEYELRSKHIMLVLSDEAPTDAFPSGFKGITTYGPSGSTVGDITYKTKYFDAGETLYYDASGIAQTTNGDKVKKVSLGFSTQDHFTYDDDLLKYKGKDASKATKGFHLSVNAATITGTSGEALFTTTAYDLEGVDKDKLAKATYRKFTMPVFGGFDGWDIYRRTRTYGDGFIFGKTTYSAGSDTNGGVFSHTGGNSDYYAYLQGINTYSNPEAIDINLFATPGINWNDHSSLVNQAIDIIENDRADSLYIINSPNFTGTTGTAEVVSAIQDLALDSNYSATYWPWIQVRDTDNATQLYIPPTGEVLKNIALTDNVAYPWFAVAGYSRGIVTSIKASKKLTLDDRDELYKNRINPIATFSDTGTIIWGNKTLQVRESALDRINVRRLLLRARKLISAVAVRLLFEQNDDQVRQEFLRLVNPILESIKKERGLYDFRVTVSNDPEDIDANTLRGKIYVKPTRALEFIDVEFVITPTGASFENV